MKRIQCTALALLVVLRAAPVAALSEVICTGDCNYDHTTTIDELVTGVAIALDQASIDTCRGFDLNGDGAATVDELIGGVRNALDGCPRARLERTACDFMSPPGQDPTGAECGFAIVQEDRGQNDGRTVRIPFLLCRATAPNHLTFPIAVFNGGPGNPSLENSECDDPDSNPFRVQFDLIQFDQRGAGRSLPSLDCPEWRAAFSANLPAAQSVEEDAAALRTAMRACHDRLLAEGVNFAAYTSSASAHDVQDLMLALGYGEWNLYGFSYGTRVELTAMRDTPDHISSVVLDSAVPVQEQVVSLAANVERSLNTLFAGCAKDPACNAAFPKLEQTFFGLVAELNAHPRTLHPDNPDGGAPLTVVATGDRLVLYVESALQDTGSIPFLPLLIGGAAAGDNGLLTDAFAQFAAQYPTAQGVYYSVLCNEEVPFVTPAIVAAATAGVREEIKKVSLAFETQLLFDICAFWGSPPPPAIENERVVSDIPTLILSGEYDPSTPPAYGQLVAQTLSHSSFFEFPGVGHGVAGLGLECATDIALAFQTDPSQPVDGSCVAAIPPPQFVEQ